MNNNTENNSLCTVRLKCIMRSKIANWKKIQKYNLRLCLYQSEPSRLVDWWWLSTKLITDLIWSQQRGQVNALKIWFEEQIWFAWSLNTAEIILLLLWLNARGCSISKKRKKERTDAIKIATVWDNCFISGLNNYSVIKNVKFLYFSTIHTLICTVDYSLFGYI